MREFTKEEIKEIRSKLKECKDEWLEKNAKGKPALGVWTVQQILDNATEGLWSFDIEKEWREEVNKFIKSSNQWVFDGYVYHVRGRLTIDGLGTRTQYGSKVAIGGKDNQNSSYKSAASDCLKKCASLFGVGSSIYSSIKVELDEPVDEYNALQNNPQYRVCQQQTYQQPQQQEVQPYQDEQGNIWDWNYQTQQWVIRQQQQVAPSPESLNQTQWQAPQQASWQQQENPWVDIEPNNQTYAWDPAQDIIQTANQIEQEEAQGTLPEAPFENVPQQASEYQAKEKGEVQPKGGAQPQSEAQQQKFQAEQKEYGAPVGGQQVPPSNPWDSPQVRKELQVFAKHKSRLGINDDTQLLPHIRDYFKDGSATMEFITADTIQGFNAYLNNIQP